MKKGGQGPRGIVGRIPFREKTCQCPKARCRAVAGQGEHGAGVARRRAFVFSRDGGGRFLRRRLERLTAKRRAPPLRPGTIRSPSPGRLTAYRRVPAAGRERLPLRRREIGVAACALRRASPEAGAGEPSAPSGRGTAASGARHVRSAGQGCRRESAARQGAVLCPQLSRSGCVFGGRALRKDALGERMRRAKASAGKGVSEAPGWGPPERRRSLHARCSTFRAQALPASIRSRPFLR